MIIERVKSGIDGFDELVQGGFPKGHTILVSGSPGTGKTIFSLGFLYYGAMNGEKSIYITFSQDIEEVIVQGEVFGWDLRPLIDNGMLKLISMDMKDVKVVDMLDEIKRGEYKRVVIDSLSAILLHPLAWKDMDVSYRVTGKVDETIASRILLNEILTEIKKMDCTSVVISELIEDSKGLSRDTVSEFIVDAVITMHYTIMGSMPGRNLVIRKMRATGHSESIHPIKFVEGIGIKVIMP